LEKYEYNRNQRSQVQIKAAVAKWSVSISTVKSSRLGCSMQVETLQYDIKALQEDVNDKKPS